MKTRTSDKLEPLVPQADTFQLLGYLQTRPDLYSVSIYMRDDQVQIAFMFKAVARGICGRHSVTESSITLAVNAAVALYKQNSHLELADKVDQLGSTTAMTEMRSFSAIAQHIADRWAISPSPESLRTALCESKHVVPLEVPSNYYIMLGEGFVRK